MRVRIKKTPTEQEVDGVKLDQLPAGAVREVSSSIGAWLIAAGYAEPEMRKPRPEESDMLFTAEPPTNPVNPPKRRRRSDLDRRRSQS